MRCADCFWWDQGPSTKTRYGVLSSRTGLCRYSAPLPVAGFVATAPWAETYGDDWCSHFRGSEENEENKK